jgi:curved DNA-binding protein CbpA
LKDKTYYEILGVAPHVGSGQIQAAYRFARGLYSGESTPTYGLLDAEERVQMLALVEEAYAALSNPNVRRDYDAHLVSAPGKVALRVDPPRHPPASIASTPSRRTGHELVTAPALDAPVDPIHVPEQVNGAVLRSMRESRRLTIDQIAALSKIGSRFLTALEEDRHTALPGRVFARGFLIEYARALRASETELVERYLRHWTAK